MSKKIIKWAITLLLLAIIVFLGVKYVPRTDWYKNFTADKGGKITAIELVKAYQENTQKADSLYSGSQGKFLEVEGVVSNVSQEGETTIVNLQSADSMVMVSCSMKTKIDNISAGQKLIIKGKCNGMNMDVELNEAEVLSLLK